MILITLAAIILSIVALTDLKPDNIGFTEDGTLKLFDFGLSTCVQTRTFSNEAYNMTGYTGSLRYMAPEVALREPYGEKVDVYSFAIMLWQMATDTLPFTGLGKTAFMEDVVRGDQRPKIDRSWPEGFSKLLSNCWHRDPEQRPSFALILIELNSLMNAATNADSNANNSAGSSGGIRKGRIIRGIQQNLNINNNPHSSWF